MNYLGIINCGNIELPAATVLDFVEHSFNIGFSGRKVGPHR